MHEWICGGGGGGERAKRWRVEEEKKGRAVKRDENCQSERSIESKLAK